MCLRDRKNVLEIWLEWREQGGVLGNEVRGGGGRYWRSGRPCPEWRMDSKVNASKPLKQVLKFSMHEPFKGLLTSNAEGEYTVAKVVSYCKVGLRSFYKK